MSSLPKIQQMLAEEFDSTALKVEKVIGGGQHAGHGADQDIAVQHVA